MNEMQVFNNPEFGAVRTLMIEGEPWAVGKDVATALGYKNTRQAIATNVDEEDKGVHSVDTPSGTQEMVVINESGIYSLILSSKLPSAKRFKRWVTSEVLPSLRKTGKYAIPGIEQRELTSDDYLTAARILAGCRNERLPYVLTLIKKAGIEIDVASGCQVVRTSSKDPNTARLLTDAHDRHGVSFRALERLTGIDTVQLYRMMRGTSRYNAARAAIIREVIHTLIPELDMSDYAEDTEIE